MKRCCLPAGYCVSISNAHEIVRPCRTSCAAATLCAGSMWLRVPSSSSSPHRPQFDSVSNHPKTSASLGTSRGAAWLMRVLSAVGDELVGKAVQRIHASIEVVGLTAVVQPRQHLQFGEPCFFQGGDD